MMAVSSGDADDSADFDELGHYVPKMLVTGAVPELSNWTPERAVGSARLTQVIGSGPSPSKRQRSLVERSRSRSRVGSIDSAEVSARATPRPRSLVRWRARNLS